MDRSTKKPTIVSGTTHFESRYHSRSSLAETRKPMRVRQAMPTAEYRNQTVGLRRRDVGSSSRASSWSSGMRKSCPVGSSNHTTCGSERAPGEALAIHPAGSFSGEPCSPGYSSSRARRNSRPATTPHGYAVSVRSLASISNRSAAQRIGAAGPAAVAARSAQVPSPDTTKGRMERAVARSAAAPCQAASDATTRRLLG